MIAALEVLFLLFLLLLVFVIYSRLVRSPTFNRLVNGVTEIPPQTDDEVIAAYERRQQELEAKIAEAEAEIAKKKKTVSKAKRVRNS